MHYVLRSSKRESSVYQAVGECLVFLDDVSVCEGLMRLSWTSYLHDMMDGQALNGNEVALEEMRIESNISTASN